MITLSSTSSLTLIFNSVLATYMLGEVFTKFDLISILLIGLGAGVCVSFSSLEESKQTYDVNLISTLIYHVALGRNVPLYTQFNSICGHSHILNVGYQDGRQVRL